MSFLGQRLVRNRSWALWVAALFVPSACAPSTTPPPRAMPAWNNAETRCLSIGAWNDLHGQISPDTPTIDTARIPAGGIIALADAIDDLRRTGDAVVLLDAGDLFTGPLASTRAEGAPILEAYALIGLDAATVGNHEFDFGPVGYDTVTAPPGVGDEALARGPRGALMANMARASFPFVSANIHDHATGRRPAWPNFGASTIVRRDGFDVGVVGYSTEGTPRTTLKPNVVGLDFTTNAAASVAREVHALRAAGASPVVLLAHASLEGELPQVLDDPTDPEGSAREGEIASLVRALGEDRPDVIVAGHRHAWMLGRVSGIPIVSSDHHGVGLARIRFCRDDGDVRFRSIDRSVVLASSPPRTSLGTRVARAMQPWLDRAKVEAETVITTLPRTCPDEAPDGAQITEQVARAIQEHVGDAAQPPPGVPVVAITNAGGIRAPLHDGPLTVAELFGTFPFENTVSVCATTRAGVERAVQNALVNNAGRERFPFGLAGAHAMVSRAADDTLSLTRLDIPGAKPGPDAPVWFALPDFVLDGGDGFLDGITCTSTFRSSSRVREAWRALLVKEHGGCDGPARNVEVHGH